MAGQATLRAGHPSLGRLRRLARRRSARSEEGAFVIDGPTLLDEALRAGVAVEEVFVEPGGDGPVVEAARSSGARTRSVAAGALAAATGLSAPQQVAAIARRTEAPLAEAVAAAGRSPLSLVLAGVADPGNAGTLLRAAEAAGAAAVLFCAGAVDPSNPKCVRASAGAVFHVTVALGGEVKEVLEQLEAAGVARAATAVRGGTPYDEVDLTGPVALVLGNEAHGVAPGVAALVDLELSIPMVGRAESLNVAMAGSVLAFESLRQRRARSREP